MKRYFLSFLLFIVTGMSCVHGIPSLRLNDNVCKYEIGTDVTVAINKKLCTYSIDIHPINNKRTLEDISKDAVAFCEKNVIPELVAKNCPSEELLVLWEICANIVLLQADIYRDFANLPSDNFDGICFNRYKENTNPTWISSLRNKQLPNRTGDLNNWTLLFRDDLISQIVQNPHEIKESINGAKLGKIDGNIESELQNLTRFQGNLSNVTYNKPLMGGLIGIGWLLGGISGGVCAGYWYHLSIQEDIGNLLCYNKDTVSKWVDTQRQRSTEIVKMLERYNEIQNQIKQIFSPMENIAWLNKKNKTAVRPVFAKGLKDGDWKRLQRNYQEMYLKMYAAKYAKEIEMEDAYINFPLIVILREGIANCQFFVKQREVYLNQDNERELFRFENALKKGLEELRKMHDECFKYSTSSLLLWQSMCYNDICSFSFIKSGRPEYDEQEEIEGWIKDINNGKITPDSEERENQKRYCSNIADLEKDYFNLLQVDLILSAEKHRNLREIIFMSSVTNNCSLETWLARAEEWSSNMKKYRKCAFAGTMKIPDDEHGLVKIVNQFLKCPPVKTLQALQAYQALQVNEVNTKLKVLCDSVQDISNIEDLRKRVEECKLRKNKEFVAALLSLPGSIDGEEARVLSLQELNEYINAKLLKYVNLKKLEQLPFPR